MMMRWMCMCQIHCYDILKKYGGNEVEDVLASVQIAGSAASRDCSIPSTVRHFRF